MELVLTRFEFTDESTIGQIEVDGKFACWSLEDVVRTGPKVHGKTAIPEGRYLVGITYSNRFKKPLPLVFNVPNFLGIRIHSGNDSGDTEGCILVGQTRGTNRLGNSRPAFDALFKKLSEANKREKIYLTIKKR